MVSIISLPKFLISVNQLPKEQLIFEYDAVFRDPAFASNKTMPVHRWVPWIAGFSGKFVDDVFREFLPVRKNRRPLVLDPFSGVGTTLFQAMLHGFSTVGFEINPYAVLCARTKLNAANIKIAHLDTIIETLQKIGTRGASKIISSSRPAQFRSRIPFFAPKIEGQVLQVLGLTDAIRNPDIADLIRVAFGSIMVSVSNYSYEPSLGTRTGAGKPLIDDANVAEVLASKLRQIREDILWVQQRMPQANKTIRRQVYCEDFLSLNGQLEASSVDLMVTSPPYMNNYHYVRNTRPQLFWLSLVSDRKELRQLEESNFGKYWQTVRDKDQVELEAKTRSLEKVVCRLRSIRTTSGSYGGPGWANYVATYFNDCSRFLCNLRRVLKKGGTGVVVLGNSIIQGMEIKTDRILGDLAIENGLQARAHSRN